MCARSETCIGSLEMSIAFVTYLWWFTFFGAFLELVNGDRNNADCQKVNTSDQKL